MTQEQINDIVEEYRRCREFAKHKSDNASIRNFYEGKIAGTKYTLEVAGVYVKEVAMLL